MSFACRFVASALILLCVSSPLLAQVPEKVENWTAPPYWMLVKPHEKGAEPGPAPQAVTAVPTSALAFTGIPPCRLADTRGNGFAGQYGPPQIAAATGRTMTIAGQCGIPGNAEAVSFNFSAVNVPGPGFLVAYPAGGAFPPVATLVYNQNTPNLSNAAVVPLGTGGAITVVAGVVPVDLVIDVNGYYGPQGGPGGLLPSGSFGQTLRHNGTSWVASDALRNDGTDVSLSGVLRFPAFVRATAGLSCCFTIPVLPDPRTHSSASTPETSPRLVTAATRPTGLAPCIWSRAGTTTPPLEETLSPRIKTEAQTPPLEEAHSFRIKTGGQTPRSGLARCFRTLTAATTLPSAG